jgi:hypothetical protein
VAVQALEGKPFATIGFGQKQYPRFCAAAEVFLQMASEARVKNLQPMGKCNGDGNEEADFRLWVSDLLVKYAEEGLLKAPLLERLQARLLLDQADTTVRFLFPPLLFCILCFAPRGLCCGGDHWMDRSSKLCLHILNASQRGHGRQLRGASALQVKPPTLKVIAAPAGSKAKEDGSRFPVPVKSSKQLLVGGSGDRATTLVTLDLTSLPFVQYSPGDYLVVYPENSPKARFPLSFLVERKSSRPRAWSHLSTLTGLIEWPLWAGVGMPEPSSWRLVADALSFEVRG